MNNVYNEIESKNVNETINNLSSLEEKTSTIIVYTPYNEDIDSINESINNMFYSKKIKPNKFWITQDVLDSLETKSVNKIYDQGISKYQVLTKFIKKDNYLFVVALPLPYMNEAINIINKFNIIIMIISVGLMIFLINVISKEIVRPLYNLRDLSNDIALLNFRKEEIKSNDEIEELSLSINLMSERLEKAHDEINTQNKRLKELVSDVSHELKTPLAVIKIYTQGLEDGLDDGSYMGIIQHEIDKMDKLIENLLFWAKLEKKTIVKTNFDLVEKLTNISKKYKLIFNENNINFKITFDKNRDFIVFADEDGLDIVFNNLITNAIKYTNNSNIEIHICTYDNRIKFTITNGIKDMKSSELENLWEPFYVLEKSRNKELSGTGLGLPIVKTILERNNLNFGFNIENREIEFYIIF